MSPSIELLFTRLRAQSSFEGAASVLIQALAEVLQAALQETGWAETTTQLRGAVHLRPDLGYRGLFSLELGGDQAGASPWTSTTAWRAISERGTGFWIDVTSRSFVPLTGADWSPTAGGAGAAAFTQSRRVLSARDTTHLVALPLRGVGGTCGMVTLELRSPDLVGDGDFEPWTRCGAALEALASLGALFLDRLPFSDTSAAVQSPFPAVSPKGQDTIRTLLQFAQLDQPLLLLGESGTGKSWLARWIHDRSGRAGPFVSADVAALSPEMASVRLFGSKRGAFTSAENQQGLVRQAEGGTLFIDEVARLSPDTQVQLFRLLDEGRYRPLGPADEVKVNVRLIVATNEDLRALIQDRRFREDLYYRLDTLAVEIPPLRERADEIEGWARHFLVEIHRSRTHNHHVSLSAGAALILRQQRWPGNLRDLRGTVERAWLAACRRVCPDVGRWPTEVRVEEEDVRAALSSARSRRGARPLLTLIEECAESFVEEADRLRREGARPPGLDEALGIQGAVVAAALRQQADPSSAARLLGVEALIHAGNHLKRFRKDFAAFQELARAVGAEVPPLPEALTPRGGGSPQS